MQEAQAGPNPTAPNSTYLVRGLRFETDSPGFAEAVAAAHASHDRPRCLCLLDGIEMYVARLGDGFIVKRMPNTGSHHAPDCPSYEPPPELTGLGEVIGGAIREDPSDGSTTLRFGFCLSKSGAHHNPPGPGDGGASVASDGSKLTLRGLLHYLWDQAELTRWQPGFAGKRSWATVRRHLLQAAEQKIAKGEALQERLFIPEVFSVEHRDAIDIRRTAQLLHAGTSPRGARRLMLLIGEVKEIVPARYGHKAVIKHLPDTPFALDAGLFGRMERRFERELSLWGASESLHMVMVATFGINAAGVPAIEELALMPTTANWIPVEHAIDLQLVERLTREGRRFVKGLRYNMPSDQALASAVLTDAGETPVAMRIHTPDQLGGGNRLAADVGANLAVGNWDWFVAIGAMPALPALAPSLAGFRPKLAQRLPDQQQVATSLQPDTA